MYCYINLRVYFQEIVSGVLRVNSSSDIKHDGIFMEMDGTVNLQMSSKNVGIFDAFYNSVKVNNYTIIQET